MKIILCLLLVNVYIYAIQTIDVTSGRIGKTNIAINNFKFQDDESKYFIDDVIKIVSGDLNNSGLFKTIDPAAFIETKTGTSYTPVFASWRQINAVVLVNGDIVKIAPNIFRINIIIWDTASERNIINKSFEVPKSLLRKAAHKFADTIYERITGEVGYFDTQIVYIAEFGPRDKRVKRVALMDQDGANHRFLTDGKRLALTPRFAPSSNEIMYLSFIKKHPRIYIKNLEQVNKKDKLLEKLPGMSLAPRYSHDGKKAVFSIAKNGSTSIYEMNFVTNTIKKLTQDFGTISISASYSPDDSKIVFSSDRHGGVPQLYIMNSDGSNVKRLTFGKGSYNSPNWSPRADYIAFTKVNREYGFSIGVIKTDGSGERILTNGYLVESPTWSPNGRVIIFTREEPAKGDKPSYSKLYSIDLTGYNERIINTPVDASDADWSTLGN